MWWRRRINRALPLGPRGEAEAERFLKKHGYKILGRNLRFGHLELDILARDGDTVVFVEVRSRASADEVPPEDTVGPIKRKRLRAAAESYIARNYTPDTYYRFDVVSVLIPPDPEPLKITHYVDAF